MNEHSGLYTVTGDGQIACRLCHALGYRHDRHCPVVVLRLQLRELTAQLGLFVATMRDTVDSVDTVLRGPDAAEEETRS